MGLFSTYVKEETTKLVPYEKTVNITEKKAPTDESIRLLNEFQDKATRNLVGAFMVESNILKAGVLAFEDDASFNGINIWAKFNLNGYDKEFRFVVSRDEYNNFKSGERNLIIQNVKERFAQEIVREMSKANTEFKIAILKHTK